jgi:carbon-monoxide dehydrogenase medium subunit
VIPFSYHRLKGLQELWQLMAEPPNRFSLLAGGTDLLVRIRKGRSTPQAVIDLKNVRDLRPDIQLVDGSLSSGVQE